MKESKNIKYCAFLRGVNVKGTNMKMADVCNVFIKADMSDVTSVLATGNILFSSDKNPKDCKIILEKALSIAFNYEAFLFVKSMDEVKSYVEHNPFTIKDNFHIYIFVGVDDIENILLNEYIKYPKSKIEELKIINRKLYWQIEKGKTLDSFLGKILSKKSLKNQLTSRNINTFEKIIEKHF